MNESSETDQLNPPKPRGSPEKLLELVEKWLAEDNGYDEEAWPVIAKAIEENRLSSRHRLSDTTG